MSWLPLAIGLALLIGFVFARRAFRKWLIEQWLHDRLGNRRFALLLVVSYALPIFLITAWGVATNPIGSLPLVLLMAGFIALLTGGTAGLVEYAATHGVRDHLRRQRRIEVDQ